jgi:hypothetical protein
MRTERARNDIYKQGMMSMEITAVGREKQQARVFP